ncbi:MAG: alpha/beta hydrolase [Terracoccus sp.]
MEIVLVPGLWLDGASWDPVAERLRAAGHEVTALTLPGLESPQSDRSAITLEDHVAAVVAAVDAAHASGGPVLLVGHSAASALVACAVDARPEEVARVVYIGGFPSADGEQFMRGLEADGDGVPFPGWDAFEGPDSRDIDDATKQRLLEGFVPTPLGVMTGTVHLSDDRRQDVPATAICPEFSPDELRAWIDEGELPELARARHLELVDIDSGHWPQVTVPEVLADLLIAETRR